MDDDAVRAGGGHRAEPWTDPTDLGNGDVDAVVRAEDALLPGRPGAVGDTGAAPLCRANVFVLVGVAWVVAGGLVAAATGPMRLAHGSWAAAFQVLVAGLSQGALGVTQDLLAPDRPSRRVVIAQLLTWNLGSAAVLGGTLARTPLVVDVGGLLLLATLALMVRTVRAGAGPAWATWVYRIVVTVIIVSIPIDLVLAHSRAS